DQCGRPKWLRPKVFRAFLLSCFRDGIWGAKPAGGEPQVGGFLAGAVTRVVQSSRQGIREPCCGPGRLTKPGSRAWGPGAPPTSLSTTSSLSGPEESRVRELRNRRRPGPELPARLCGPGRLRPPADRDRPAALADHPAAARAAL